MIEALTGAGYGLAVELKFPEELGAAVRELLPHWWADTCLSPDRSWTVSDLEDVETTISELELWVAEHARELIFVHAGVVELDRGAVLLPGRSLSGKSTLTNELVAQGCGYLSDEYAVLDAQGRVHAYPRPLQLRTPSGRRRIPVNDLGTRVPLRPLPVIAVLSLHYEEAAAFEPTSISNAAAVLELFDNTIPATTRPSDSLHVLTEACVGAHCYRGSRGDARETARTLIELVRELIRPMGTDNRPDCRR